MPKRTVKNILADIDTISQTITGRKLAPNLLRIYEVYKQSAEPLNGDDTEDYKDCELLGVSPNATERVVKVALKAYQVDNHPDKFLDPTLKKEAGERFKAAGHAFNRIREKRGW